MNNQEAKFILSAYRANGSDARDEMFSEALRQARQDPMLGAWLAREQAHDAAMVRKLAEITPPVGLREAILTGARVSGTRRPLWRQPLWMTLGAAAAALLVVSAAVWPRRALAGGNALAAFALRDTAYDRHNGHGDQVKVLQAMLGDPKTHLRGGLGVDFEALRGTGCRTVQVDGRDAFEICFNRNGTWFHLYAMRDFGASGSATKSDVAIEQRAKFCCAAWSDATTGYRYAVVGDSGVESVKSLL
jgi:hypothetical protein